MKYAGKFNVDRHESIKVFMKNGCIMFKLDIKKISFMGFYLKKLHLRVATLGVLIFIFAIISIKIVAVIQINIMLWVSSTYNFIHIFKLFYMWSYTTTWLIFLINYSLKFPSNFTKYPPTFDMHFLIGQTPEDLTEPIKAIFIYQNPCSLTIFIMD